MPAARKNSASSRESGAAPEKANRKREPRTLRIFEKTSLSATFALRASDPGTFPPRSSYSSLSFPTLTAQ